jgi:hypothetical protein
MVEVINDIIKAIGFIIFIIIVICIGSIFTTIVLIIIGDNDEVTVSKYEGNILLLPAIKNRKQSEVHQSQSKEGSFKEALTLSTPGSRVSKGCQASHQMLDIVILQILNL